MLGAAGWSGAVRRSDRGAHPGAVRKTLKTAREKDPYGSKRLSVGRDGLGLVKGDLDKA